MQNPPSSTQTVARSREKHDSSIDLVALEDAEKIEEFETEFNKNTVLSKRKIFAAKSWKRKYFAITLVASLLVLLSLAYIDRLTTADAIARGVSISGVNVGSMSQEEAIEKLESEIQNALHSSMRFHLEDDTVSISPQDLELQYDAVASVNQAIEVNRSLNPISVVPSFFQRVFTGKNIDVVNSYDEEKYEDVVQHLVESLSEGRADAGIEIEGTSVRIIEPQTGEGVSESQAENSLSYLTNSFDRTTQEMYLEEVQAQITSAEARRVAAILRNMFSNDSTLATPNSNQIQISKELLASVTTVTPEGSRLEIGLDQEKLRSELSEILNSIETPAQDATFSINGNSVSIVPEINGKIVDFDAALKNWINGEHNFIVPIKEVKPKRDSTWAKSLNITEQVSTFTTSFTPGQARVTNIRRAAEVVNGTILEPGQTFSLNDTLGPRTAESGYVRAPAFSVSEGFYDDFGGGVSQFSTTLFNAYYFGGYKNITHKPHTIYISRYPMGREATLNYGSVDLKFQNDSNSGVYIRATTSNNSVTVTLYGNKEGKTVSTEGPNIIEEIPYGIEYEDDPNLPVGTEREIQQGYPGIVVENYRIIERAGQEPRRERFRWAYKMIPKKVVRGTQQAAS